MDTRGLHRARTPGAESLPRRFRLFMVVLALFMLGNSTDAFLLLRLSDGATDVIVGVLSDRTRSQWGPRKPWLLASVPLAILSAWGLYVPGESANIWQFALCYFFFYLAWTFFDIPYTAWSAELGRSYEDRSRLALSRQLASSIGLIVLSLVPLLPFLPSTEMNFATLEVTFWVVAIAYPLGVLYAFFRVPKGEFVPAMQGGGLRESARQLICRETLKTERSYQYCNELATPAFYVT